MSTKGNRQPRKIRFDAQLAFRVIRYTGKAPAPIGGRPDLPLPRHTCEEARRTEGQPEQG